MNDEGQHGMLLAPAACTPTDRRRGRANAAVEALAGTDPTATLRLVRADDQLDVRIELFGVEIAGDQVTPTGADAAMRLSFGAQHVAEGAFVAPDPTPPAGAVAHICAGESVVVVPISDSFTLTVGGVLALAGGGLAGQSSAGAPDGSATAIEVPAGLVLSPAEPAALVAATGPFIVDGVGEVWAATLASADGSGPLGVAAIANRSAADLVATGPPDVTSRVPDAAARDDLVTNSTTIAPIAARRLALTSAGAFADLHGEWPVGLALYDHRIRCGRDIRVEVSSLGYLAPFGHRAAIVEVSQRTTATDDAGGDTSVLVVERHLQIIEPVVTTPRPFAQHLGHGLPLMTVTVDADESAPITTQPVVDAAGHPIDGVFDIRSGSADLVVEHLAVDRAGNTVAFALPATFVDDSVAHGTGAADAPARLRDVANGAARRPRREVDLAGQLVAYADPLTPTSPVAKQTHTFTLSWEGPDPAATVDDLAAARSPAIFAVLEHAEVVDDVAGAVTGVVGELIGVTLHPRWLVAGNLAENFDQAFLTLDLPTISRLGGDSIVTGVARLDMVAEVFNQLTGAGPQRDAPDSPFDAGDILGDGAKIIGNILLKDVIELIEAELPGTEITIDPESRSVTTEYTFCPTLHDLDRVGFKTTEDTKCCVHLSATAALDDGLDASFTTELRVQDFLLELPPIPAPLVVVDFASVVGTIHSDGPPTIVPTIREWDFSGTISLLLSLVDALGFGNVDVKVRGELIDIDSTFNLPDVTLGVAELKNFNINLGLDLPLGSGQGQLSIGIGSKASPLDIEVMMFGGTFWLEIGLGFDGLAPPTSTISIGVAVYWEMLDFDIVVAHATFTLRLSADFRLQGDEVVFTGAVSLEGEIEILGMLSASASIVASLTYRSADEEMVLRGTIDYCVDSFLGKLTSGSVPIGETTIELGDGDGASAVAPRQARRATAATGAGSSSFAQRYDRSEWTDYCDAFAA